MNENKVRNCCFYTIFILLYCQFVEQVFIKAIEHFSKGKKKKKTIEQSNVIATTNNSINRVILLCSQIS